MRDRLSLFLVPFFSILLFLLSPHTLIAHGGRTDASGGHYNRKTGDYHYHNSGSSPRRQESPPSYKPNPTRPEDSGSLSARSSSAPSYSSKNQSHTPDPEGSVGDLKKEAKIYTYFRSGNEGVGALDCSVKQTERDVSQNTKDKILNRDGYRCVICDSTLALEVDHKRGLQNGGDNSEVNLATLCDDCHKRKTKLDGSLRRKREKMCR